MNPKDFVEIKYGQWWEQVSQGATKKKHARNIKACLGAVDHHNQEKRPLNVLLIHGSGRSSFSSAAQELSNSQLLLRLGTHAGALSSGSQVRRHALFDGRQPVSDVYPSENFS